MTTPPHHVYLDGLEVCDFRGFPEAQALKLDGNHLLLYGENGSGKTSIFQAIAELLQLSPDATPYNNDLADVRCLKNRLQTKRAPMDTSPYASPGWQFSFNGIRIFISVFSPLYPPDHVRHSPTTTFVVFQPETSFDQHNIGSRFAESYKIKKQVRSQFLDKNIFYPSAVIDARNEAAIYLLPRWDGDDSTIWWSNNSAIPAFF
jgi:energy-coupling factor transporter ATP-binding protein EcfA2